jgi:TM2 domain-containing membrane protein YozV
MRKIKTLFFITIAIALALSTSATTIPKTIAPTIAQTNIVVEPVTKTYDYKALKSLAENKLGRKLTVKEKIILKLAKRKINNVISKMPKADENKSQTAAALLCILLGIFGVHDFYLGHTILGVAKILIFIISFFIGLLFSVLLAWVLVDFILILIGIKKPKNGDYN